MENLRPMLEKSALSDDDYDLLFLQTGLSKAGIDALISQGQQGMDQIFITQTQFFNRKRTHCELLLGARFTCEDLLQDQNGIPAKSVPLVPLEQGDILVSYSTHTMGWRHGHAGLVVDAENQQVLEAVQMGSDSYRKKAEHWRNYSTFMVLRVKDSTQEERQQAADFAIKFLEGVPYSLLSGLQGKKVQNESMPMKAHCAYLPWRAWMSVGVDVDGDGGKIVTVQDLAASKNLEIVQLYGIDPEPLLERQCRN